MKINELIEARMKPRKTSTRDAEKRLGRQLDYVKKRYRDLEKAEQKKDYNKLAAAADDIETAMRGVVDAARELGASDPNPFEDPLDFGMF